MMKVCLEDSYSTTEAPEISNLVFPVQTLAHEMASFCSVWVSLHYLGQTEEEGGWGMLAVSEATLHQMPLFIFIK